MADADIMRLINTEKPMSLYPEHLSTETMQRPIWVSAPADLFAKNPTHKGARD